MLKVLQAALLKANSIKNEARSGLSGCSLLLVCKGEIYLKKRLLAIALCAAMLVSAVFTGCKSEGTPSTESKSGGTTEPNSSSVPADGGFKTVSYEASNDKYRNYYEIFVYSFCDSDGDGIGDFKGLTSKLDYLNDGDPNTTDDLGIDGIWLMPIMKSGTYHKYDVRDYYSIDPAYGTMDDFKEFLEEAHKRGIDVIIDLVLNHTSNVHEWFKNAKAELKEGKTDGYAQYYHFKKADKKPSDDYFYAGTKGWYYESAFKTQEMPDLNWENENVRNEIKKICDYWLKDIKIDGFRLDAAYHYDTNYKESIKDVKWLNDYCKSIKDDAYIIAEVWQGGGTIAEFYESGLDSFFNFDMEGASGQAVKAINTENCQSYFDYIKTWQDTISESNKNAISAPFLSNHDTARSAGFLGRDSQREKNAAMAYLMTPGNPFIYYGEEIGMTGSSNDPEKRTGMVWSLTDNTGYVPSIPGSSNTEKPNEGVEEAQKNENSLLNFYKKILRLKLQNPEIARGTFTPVVLDSNNVKVGAYISEYNGSKVMVVMNLGSEKSTVTVPQSKMSYSGVRGYAISDTANTDKVELNGEQLTIPANSVVVLK